LRGSGDKRIDLAASGERFTVSLKCNSASRLTSKVSLTDSTFPVCSVYRALAGVEPCFADIANHRLVSFADGQVTFRWRDSAHHNEQKLTALSHDKFLRRFLLHILPQGFVRIRHFGFLACRRRRTTLPLCFQ
jgi:Putative transposase.